MHKIDDIEKVSVFLVEDNELFAELLAGQLRDETNYDPVIYLTGEDMIAAIEQGQKPDMIVLDYYLDSVRIDAQNGRQILHYLQDHWPKVPVVILSSLEDVGKAVGLLKFGASDYIVKSDAAFYQLKRALDNILEVRALQKEVRHLKKQSKNIKNRLFVAFILLVVLLLIIIRELI